MKKWLSNLVTVVLVGVLSCSSLAVGVFADSREEDVSAKKIHFPSDDKGKYSVDKYIDDADTSKNTLGTFSVNGNFVNSTKEGDIATYVVKNPSGTSRMEVSFEYNLKSGIPYKSDTDDGDWYLVKDGHDEVNGEELSDDVDLGAIIVQISTDGEKWKTLKDETDIFNEKSDFSSEVYTAQEIEINNSRYYRIIVVYEMEKVTGKTVIGTKTHDEKNVAEVYLFRLTCENPVVFTEGYKVDKGVINTGKDNGFNSANATTIDKKDPHFGWEIGEFLVSGYSDVDKKGDCPTILKNVDDEVTLWFKMNDIDITCINGDNDIVIYADTNGYDVDFGKNGISNDLFGKDSIGTLIVQYTDPDNNTHDPIVYNNFLLACAGQNANTSIKLYEEGYYKVALDYEIADGSVIKTYTNYKIMFEFRVANGSCNVFAFEIDPNMQGSSSFVPGSYLGDNAITQYGFKLDMAKSRNLTLSVERSNLIVETSNSEVTYLKWDSMGPVATADNSEFTTPGRYKISVTNDVTGASAEKYIYVDDGSLTPYYIAIIRHGDIDYVNRRLAAGDQLSSDGEWKEVTPSPTPIPAQNDEIEDTTSTIKKENELVNLDASNVTKSETVDDTEKELKVEKKSSNAIWIVLGTVGVIGVAGAGVVAGMFLGRKKKN